MRKRLQTMLFKNVSAGVRCYYSNGFEQKIEQTLGELRLDMKNLSSEVKSLSSEVKMIDGKIKYLGTEMKQLDRELRYSIKAAGWKNALWVLGAVTAPLTVMSWFGSKLITASLHPNFFGHPIPLLKNLSPTANPFMDS
eukprot:TRINITY_DN11763_c0_g1_i2.p1 TRINITY_DN11763_c0_g1~~TRINITY_DN11763_c0_g1_i2.p1  ORF type:complete len:139 (+),score=23.85 TRINITY_DN11763_c0_g1_i2:65-481(+)